MASWKDTIQPEETAQAESWKDTVQDEPEVSQLEAGTRGAAQGLSLGTIDELTGAGEAALSKLQGSDEPISDLYAKHRNESRQAYRKAEETHPGIYTTGEVAGSIGSSFIPGIGAAKGAKLASVAGRAALEGAIQGFGGSEASGSDLALDTARGGSIGLLAGAGGGLAANKIQDVLDARKLARGFNTKAEEQAALALGANKADFKTRSKLLASRKLGRNALDQGVVSPLANTEEMLSRAAALKEQGGEGLNKVYSSIDEANLSSFDPRQVAETFETKYAPEYRTPINRSEIGQFEDTLKSIRSRGSDAIDPITGQPIVSNLSMQKAQELKDEIKSVAYPKGKAPIDASPKQLMAQDALRTVDEAMQSSAEKASGQLGEDLSGLFSQAKSQYGTGIEAEKLLMAKQAGEKTQNPLKTLSTAADIAAGVAAPFTGGASLKVLVAKKLAEGIADKRHQLTAVGANKLAKIIQNNPEKLGKFSSVLASAAKRGPKALAAANYVLQNRDPEYQSVLQTLKSESNDKGVVTNSDTSDEAIEQMLEKANANGVDAEIIQNIENMKNQDEEKRSRSMFSIMQQPGLRQLFNGE